MKFHLLGFTATVVAGILLGWGTSPYFWNLQNRDIASNRNTANRSGEFPAANVQLEDELSIALRAPRSVAARIRLLCALDKCFAVDPITASNRLYQLGASSLIDIDTKYSILLKNSRDDLASLIQTCKGIDDLVVRDQIIKKAFYALAEQNSELALNIFSALPNELKNKVSAKLGLEIGNRASTDSMNVLLKHIEARSVFKPAFEQWSKNNTAAAYAFGSSVDESQILRIGTSKSSLYYAVTENASAEERLKFWSAQPVRASSVMSLNEAYAEVVAKNPTQALAALNEIPDGPRRSRIAALTAESIVGKDMALAGQLLNEVGSESLRATTGKNLIEMLMVGKQKVDLGRLSEWARQFDPATNDVMLTTLKRLQSFRASTGLEQTGKIE